MGIWFIRRVQALPWILYMLWLHGAYCKSYMGCIPLCTGPLFSRIFGWLEFFQVCWMHRRLNNYGLLIYLCLSGCRLLPSTHRWIERRIFSWSLVFPLLWYVWMINPSPDLLTSSFVGLWISFPPLNRSSPFLSQSCLKYLYLLACDGCLYGSVTVVLFCHYHEITAEKSGWLGFNPGFAAHAS